MGGHERRSVIVVGAGPAGTATALFLHRHAPALAAGALLLDKATHPRDKVCAGGLIPHTLACLAELGVPLSVPNVVVNAAEVRIPWGRVRYAGHELCRVIRRAEFDATLVRACRERGVEVRENQRVREVAREDGGIRVETDQQTYVTQVVVGADGSGSIVRRRLLEPRDVHTAQAVMCDVPVAAADWDGFSPARYEFNFNAVAERLCGYTWVFPCLIDNEPHINVGAYSMRPVGRYLREVLAGELGRLHAPGGRVKGFPIHWFHPRAPLAVPRVMLVGDAAGVDPLLGEGISHAFEYGRRAALAIVEAFGAGDFRFAAYAGSVHDSWMGKKLKRLGLLARVLYGPTWPVWFRLAAGSRRAQEIGVRWYNGVGGWDRADRWSVLRAVWRGELCVAGYANGLGGSDETAPPPAG